MTIELLGAQIGFGQAWVLWLGILAVALFAVVNRGLLRAGVGRLQFLLRCVVIFVIFIALGMPYYISEESIESEAVSIVVISDKSASMDVGGEPLAGDIQKSLNSMVGGLAKSEIIEMSEREKTALGDAIYSAIVSSPTKGTAVIVESDGNSNSGKNPLSVASFASDTGAQIYALAPEVNSKEVWISNILGADAGPIGAIYSGSVEISSLSVPEKYTLIVQADEKILVNKEIEQTIPIMGIPFETQFASQGPHKIIARISPLTGDTFSENNQFNKAVIVTRRPSVLMVTNDSNTPLEQVLMDSFDIEIVSVLPSKISQYDAIILDDIPLRKLGDVSRLRDFLRNGGGLFTVGGSESFENGEYYESEFEGILPVRSSEEERGTKEVLNVVIVLDISGSTGGSTSGNTKIDVEKALAIQMIEDLSGRANIAFVVFNSRSYLLYPLLPVDDPDMLVGKIKSLQFGGGTYVTEGLEEAKRILSGATGAKHVILISDGITNYPVSAFEDASDIKKDGGSVHAIGVGFDTDTSFMKGISSAGDGVYFGPQDTSKVKLVLGAMEESEQEESEGLPIMVIDSNHFITEGKTGGNATASNLNYVSKKSEAKLILATPQLDPILTVWRFGLGRSVALTVDSGIDWAPSLYSKEDSGLVLSALSWAVGDIARNGDLSLNCPEARVDESSTVTIISSSNKPAVYLAGNIRELSRASETAYFFDYSPQETGFVPVVAGNTSCLIATNYPVEYGAFGPDFGILDGISLTSGGRTYFPSELSSLLADISDFTIEESTSRQAVQNGLEVYVLLGALILFVIDICTRRIRQILKKPGGKKKEKKSKTILRKHGKGRHHAKGKV